MIIEELHLKELELRLISATNERNTYEDTDGYRYDLSKDNLKNIKRRNSLPAKFFRNNPHTQLNIQLYIKQNSPNVILISDSVINATTPLEFECANHGYFKKSWNEIKNGQFCPNCGRIKGNNSRKRSYTEVYTGFESRGYTLVSKEYVDNNSKLSFICNKHKDKGQQYITWGNFISLKGCSYCSKESYLSKVTKSHSDFLEELNNLDNNFILISKYIKSDLKVDVYCPDCNTRFSSKASHLLAGHKGCNCNEKSLGESKIKACLDKNSIHYQQEFRLPDCKNKRPLPFDFAIFSKSSELKFLIEFNGKQHYHPYSWGSEAVSPESHLEYVKKNDSIKQKYCLDNKIDLIIIPYWEIEKN